MAAILLVYSQTNAFAWDEGFHVLTAQLIDRGKRPYVDFCFPQTPLNAYWNALWMRVFGESWRTAHAQAAIETACATLLTGSYVLFRFPIARWRLAATIAAALLMGLNVALVVFATIGQAYCLCLLLTVAAFRAAVSAIDRSSLALSAAAGLFAGAAAASSLLTAPVLPVLLVWVLMYNRAGSRFAKAASFLVAAAFAFVPVGWLFLQGPEQTIFNLFDYHFYYRQVEWSGALSHDFDVITSVFDSPQALLLVLLAFAGLFYTVKSDWDRRWRAELYLCSWVAAALAIYISNIHPTFERYYLLAVPYLAVLATVGLYEMSWRLDPREPVLWPVAAVFLIFGATLAKRLYDERDEFFWRDLEQIARKVDQVTPPAGTLLADEQIYFLTRRTPPSGMELHDSHKLSLPPDRAALFHIVSRQQLDRRIEAGAFDTVETCDQDEKLEILPRVYTQSAEMSDCKIFWGKRAPK